MLLLVVPWSVEQTFYRRGNGPSLLFLPWPGFGASALKIRPFFYGPARRRDLAEGQGTLCNIFPVLGILRTLNCLANSFVFYPRLFLRLSNLIYLVLPTYPHAPFPRSSQPLFPFNTREVHQLASDFGQEEQL